MHVGTTTLPAQPLLSALARIALAALVALPPGTCRTLSAMVRETAADSSDAVASRDQAVDALPGERVLSADSDRPLPLHAPFPGRNWSEVTFKSENQPAGTLPWLSETWDDPLSSGRSVRLARVLASGAGPVIQAHRLPREVILALCELLQ